jgi:MFS family permease
LGLLLVGNVCLAAGLIIHAFSFNFYLRELGYTAAAMGHQVTAMTVGGLLALLPAGATIDRYGTRATMLVGVALTVAGLAISALVRDAWTINAAAVLVGLGGASCRVSWGPAIMRVTGERQRPRAFTWNVAVLVGSASVWTALAGAAPGWSAPLARATGLSGTQLVLLAGALMSALAIPCYWRLHALGAAPGTSDAAAFGTAVRRLALTRDMRLLIGVVAGWMLAAALVLPFFNIFFTDRFAMPMASVGSLFAIANVANAVVLIGAAEMARRFGPRRALTWWMVALAPSLWGLAAVNAMSLAVGLYLVQGLVAPATNPLIDQLVLERVEPSRQGLVAGWRNAAAEAAGGVGASVGGHLLDASSFGMLFLLAGAIAGLTSVLLTSAIRATPVRVSSGDGARAPRLPHEPSTEQGATAGAGGPG